MEVSHMSHTTRAALGLATLYIAYQVITSITLWARRRAFKREKGVMEAPWYPQWDKITGLNLFRKNVQALKEHRMLEVGHRRFSETSSNTYQLVLLGQHMHITTEPENLKIIQAKEHTKWSLGRRRKYGFRPLLGEGIFTTDGSAWQHSRDMLRPNFVRSQVADVDTFEKHVSQLISIIPRNQTVDLSELFFRLTIDSATEFLFGESTNSLASNTTDGFADAFTHGQDFIANLARWGSIGKLFLATKRFEKDTKFVHDFVDYYVQKGLARRDQILAEKTIGDDKSGRYVFIDELVKQTTDPIRIRSEALNILLAGRDTTASLLTNVWYTLSNRPDIWEKLQAEVKQLDDARPSFEQLKDLKYVKALLNESLRLHPVVPLNSREATEDTTLPLGGGPDGRAPIFIKKDSVMAWSVWAMHRRKDFYGEDAEEFKPERWLDDPVTGKKGLRPGWEYLPFNGGARICLGQQFALTEASYCTVRLCQAFSGIESRDPNPWTEFITLTCVNLHGAKVALTPRET